MCVVLNIIFAYYTIENAPQVSLERDILHRLTAFIPSQRAMKYSSGWNLKRNAITMKMKTYSHLS